MIHMVQFSNARSTEIFWNLLTQGGRSYVCLARTQEESWRGLHTEFFHCVLFSSGFTGCYMGALAWGHTVGSGPAIALRMTVTFSVTPENVGFSHLPWGSAKAIMQQPPSWQVGKYIKDLWLPTLGRIKWQTFVFKGHGHLNFKRKLSF